MAIPRTLAECDAAHQLRMLRSRVEMLRDGVGCSRQGNACGDGAPRLAPARRADGNDYVVGLLLLGDWRGDLGEREEGV
jgi:hypothetical protein